MTPRQPPFWANVRLLFRLFAIQEGVGASRSLFGVWRKKYLPVSISISLLSTLWMGISIASSLYALDDMKYFWLQNLWLTYAALLLGFLHLLTMGEVFLSDYDITNLLPLPVSPSAVIMSKILARVYFTLPLFLMMAVSSAVVSLFISPLGVAPGIRQVAAFIGSDLALYLFVLCGIFSIGSLLAIILKPPAFAKATHGAQILGLTATTTLLLTAIPAIEVFHSDISTLLKESPRSSGMGFFPPFWFAGLSEWLAGRQGILFERLAGTAGIATILAVILCIVSFRQYAKKAIRVISGSGRAPRARPACGRMIRSLNRKLFRNRTESALFVFYLRTIQRSRPHQIILFGYMSIPFGVAILAFLSEEIKEVIETILLSQELFLALPSLALVVFILATKAAVRQPLNLEAKWIFDLAATGSSRPLITGLKKAILILHLVPMSGILFLYLWPPLGFGNAFLSSLLNLILASIALEITYFGEDKIPFTFENEKDPQKSALAGLAKMVAVIVWVKACSTLTLSVLRERERFLIAAPVLICVRILLKKVASRKKSPVACAWEEESY
ncbi:MAG: hypothetical protein ABSG19_03250 [Candidatus Aminicenantales bacterium]